MSAHNRVAVHTATRRAHNPYRVNSYREPLPAPTITLKTRIVSVILTLKVKVARLLTAWRKPTASRATRRVVKKTFLQAKNKADPHLAERV